MDPSSSVINRVRHVEHLEGGSGYWTSPATYFLILSLFCYLKCIFLVTIYGFMAGTVVYVDFSSTLETMPDPEKDYFDQINKFTYLEYEESLLPRDYLPPLYLDIDDLVDIYSKKPINMPTTMTYNSFEYILEVKKINKILNETLSKYYSSFYFVCSFTSPFRYVKKKMLKESLYSYQVTNSIEDTFVSLDRLAIMSDDFLIYYDEFVLESIKQQKKKFKFIDGLDEDKGLVNLTELEVINSFHNAELSMEDAELTIINLRSQSVVVAQARMDFGVYDIDEYEFDMFFTSLYFNSRFVERTFDDIRGFHYNIMNLESQEKNDNYEYTHKYSHNYLVSLPPIWLKNRECLNKWSDALLLPNQVVSFKTDLDTRDRCLVKDCNREVTSIIREDEVFTGSFFKNYDMYYFSRFSSLGRFRKKQQKLLVKDESFVSRAYSEIFEEDKDYSPEAEGLITFTGKLSRIQKEQLLWYVNMIL